jgi:hypothetical protein
MRKLILLLVIVSASCSKKSDKTCYECDLNSTGTYSEQGCYIDEEWNALKLTDYNGTEINKSTHCHKK